MFLKIKFKNRIYFTDAIIKDGEVLENGFIATEYQYSNGLCSYAHLYKNGSIMRFREKIGSIEDIEIIGKKDIEPNSGAVHNVLTHPSWFPGEG